MEDFSNLLDAWCEKSRGCLGTDNSCLDALWRPAFSCSELVRRVVSSDNEGFTTRETVFLLVALSPGDLMLNDLLSLA